MMPPVPWMEVKATFRSLGACHQRAIEDQRLEAFHVSFVRFLAQDGQRSRILRRDRLEDIGLNGVDPLDDRACVRLDDLRAIPEIHFVAVVVGRVVAGSDDDPGVGIRPAHGEGQLRRGAGAIEDHDVAAIFHRD